MVSLSDSFSIREGLKQGKSQLLSVVLPGGMETPLTALTKLGAQPFLSLFESVAGGEHKGRYSFITCAPDQIWKCEGGVAFMGVASSSGSFVFVRETLAPLASLNAFMDATRLEIPHALPPMSAGLFGYFGYDMVRLMERLPSARADDLGMPEAMFSRPQIILVFDHAKEDLHVITPIWVSSPIVDVEAARLCDAAWTRLESVISLLETTLSSPTYSQFLREEDAGGKERGGGEELRACAVSNHTPQTYGAMVEKAKAYIAAGDIFQVVPSQRFSMPFPAEPLSLFKALRRLNPSPFCFFLDLGGPALVGASPEILVRVRENKVTIRPIAGTRKRGATAQEDQLLTQELLADEKECAEHLMLLDLGRNDVGRVSEPGSVKVTERMMVEYYSHVMHLVSNVEGQLRSDKTVLDALAAGFPAGTVSGAPKIRAMEIIDELESVRRSFYAGCVGYFSANGDMDSCITLRTGLVKDGMLYVQAGGGVVADSDPAFEYQESCNKAKALLTAAESALRHSNRAKVTSV